MCVRVNDAVMRIKIYIYVLFSKDTLHPLSAVVLFVSALVGSVVEVMWGHADRQTQVAARSSISLPRRGRVLTSWSLYTGS